MKLLGVPAAALSLAGRHGTLVAAASVFVGLAIPGLAAACKPYLGEAIVVMLTLAFLRVDPNELFHHFTRPGLVALATLWAMLLVPTVLGIGFLAFGLDQSMPGLYFMLVLQMSAPGLMSSPALAALLGLDVALTLATLIVSTAITPLTASLFTHVFLGSALASPFGFGLRLFLIIAGCALAAAIIRRVAGPTFIAAQRERIDGLSVIAMFMFAVAAMDGVADHFRSNPLLVIELTALAFALALGLIAVTALVFLRAGRARAFAIGLIAGNRNIGLMLAASGFAVPDVAWLYFALAQFPIYLLPH
ncbi:MAG: Na+-dependent transporter, partial [Pseudolabrys sp.]